MSKFTYLILLLCVFPASLAAENYPATAADLYAGSYTAQMRRQASYSAGRLMVRQDYSIRPVCDEHHNCRNIAFQPDAGTTLLGAKENAGDLE